jgi:hypothetical protein
MEPHISTLLHRPRPLRRSRTAPSHLPVPNATHDGSLSPAFEADELALDETDQGLTPTPSSPGSPTTPESGPHANPALMEHRHQSWDSKAGSTTWEMITIGKSVEPGDILDDELLHEDDIDDEEWLEKCKPQVAIARSMSVTKANRKVRRVRPAGPASKDSSPMLDAAAAPPTTNKRTVMKKELRMEIFGDRGMSGRDEKVLENKALTPVMHHVGDESSRKSVWGSIECI